jgi:hypothetical protein
MQKGRRYPQINIGSKNELAKRISYKSLPRNEALALINDVIANFDNYWKDSKSSQPEKGKYVRSAVGTKLGFLLKLINRKVLKPYDGLVPEFIFGGISGRDHVHAAHSLLGKRRQRSLLGLDVTTFFEQVKSDRLSYLFNKKCGCGIRAARLLAKLCCVPLGPKGSKSKKMVLARGFSTSPRLVVWSNLDIFLRAKWVASRILKGHDPRMAIYVDDVGISASRVTETTLEELSAKIKKLFAEFDANQKLPIEDQKTEKGLFTKVEYLGFNLGRNKISMANKTKAKREDLKRRITESSGSEKRKLLKKIKGYYCYSHQIKGVNQNLHKFPKHDFI